MLSEHRFPELRTRDRLRACWKHSGATFFAVLTFRSPNILTQLDAFGLSDDLLSHYRRLEHQPFASPTWNPATPSPREQNRFVRGRSKLETLVRQDEEGEDAQVFLREIYAPLDEHLGPADHIRSLLYDGPTFLGHVALARPTRFTTEELERLNQSLVPELRHALIARKALTSDLDSEHTVILLRPDGSIEHASPTAAAWLDQDRRDWLRHLILAAEKHQAFPAVPGPLELRHSVVHGIDGHRHVVSLAPWKHIQQSPLHPLTPRQRQVARRAALGATIDEIAEDLTLSSHTVRQHLKAVYRSLQVHNRVELNRRLSGA